MVEPAGLGAGADTEATGGGGVTVAAFDPLDPATQQCPEPWYALLRSQAPVFHVASRDLWFVTSRELVLEALRRPALFSSKFGRPQSPPPPEVAGRVAVIEARGWPYVPTLLTQDPPEHNRYRRLVSRAFTARYVQRLEPDIRVLVGTLLGPLLRRGDVEFVGEFARPLPLTVIARILNVGERLDDFRLWSDEITLTIGGDVDAERHLLRAERLVAFQRYFAAELEARRASPEQDRGDDLLTGLVRAHLSPDGVADDEPLSTAACLGILTQLLTAGNETTAKLLSGTMHLLGTSRRWWDWLRADPAGRAGPLADEALRLLSPVQGMFRAVTEPTVLGGVELPQGARVVLMFASANRDGSAFADADEFDPERGGAPDHLAFGHGLHYCLGAPLARLEARIALEEIGRRVASFELAAGNDFRYQPSFLLRGLERLDLHLTPAPG